MAEHHSQGGSAPPSAPTPTNERGRFYIGPNGFPRYAGSASGVYLADTVQTEIGDSPLDVSANNGIEEAFINRTNNGEPRPAESAFYAQYSLKVTDLQHEAILRERMNAYFTTWHPLFPFLDGAYLLDCFNNAIDRASALAVQADGIPGPVRAAFDDRPEGQSLVLSAIFMAVFSIGGDHSVQGLPLLYDTSHATMLAHLILGACQNSSINDLLAMQGLLAIALLLYTRRILRPAMHLSGTLTKLAFEAGLHRCPARYASTFANPSERDVRQRVFYSLYVLDRFLSADFGIPLMLSDTDVDTCLPGAKEVHPLMFPLAPAPAMRDSDTGDGRPAKRQRTQDTSSGARVTTEEEDEARRRLLPCHSLSVIARVVGRAMETFNKAIINRTAAAQDAITLRTELESWWNDIDIDNEQDGESDDPRTRFRTLFTCLYHQQHIALHRSSLALPSSSPEHAYALQATITSARVICTTLGKVFAPGCPPNECLWPGYVDMLFFSSLIMVYGSKKDPGNARLLRDLKRTLNILHSFETKWSNLKPFTRVVETFVVRVEGARPAEQALADASKEPADVPLDPFAGLLACDFVFDFDGLFGLNPDSQWAFHQSMPGSPIFHG